MAEYIIPIVSIAASVAGTIYSSVEKSHAERKIEHQAERTAAQTRAAAAQSAADEEKRHRRILATQRARYAASGVEMEGSPLLVQMESLKESEEQLRRIREGGEIQALSAEELAQAAGQRAQTAITSGLITATGQAAEGLYQKRDMWK
jgi:hypothetical protein